MIRYLVPISVLDRWLLKYERSDGPNVVLPYDSFLGLVRRLLEPVPVDEAWYLAANPGLAVAFSHHGDHFAAKHFLLHGYFENRLPFAADRTDLRQPLSFDKLRSSTPVCLSRGGLRVEMSRDDLMNLIKRLLESVPVDETWYRQTYPGVAEAIAAGGFASAAAHFVQYGYRECRWPFQMDVEEDWYLLRYADVRHRITAGDVTSAKEHFWRFGYREGRFPARLVSWAVPRAAADIPV